MPSLQALQRKVARDVLAGLQSLLVLQVVLGVSQAVNTSLARSQALARTLLLDGQQHLRDLLAAAPCLRLPLDRLPELCRFGAAEHTLEGTAARALLEMWVGLLLQWLARDSRCSRVDPVPCRRRAWPSRYPLCPRFVALPHFVPVKARSGPLVPLA